MADPNSKRVTRSQSGKSEDTETISSVDKKLSEGGGQESSVTPTPESSVWKKIGDSLFGATTSSDSGEKGEGEKKSGSSGGSSGEEDGEVPPFDVPLPLAQDVDAMEEENRKAAAKERRAERRKILDDKRKRKREEEEQKLVKFVAKHERTLKREYKEAQDRMFKIEDLDATVERLEKITKAQFVKVFPILSGYAFKSSVVLTYCLPLMQFCETTRIIFEEVRQYGEVWKGKSELGRDRFESVVSLGLVEKQEVRSAMERKYAHSWWKLPVSTQQGKYLKSHQGRVSVTLVDLECDDIHSAGRRALASKPEELLDGSKECYECYGVTFFVRPILHFVVLDPEMEGEKVVVAGADVTLELAN